MPGDARLGAVLRELRTARQLPLSAVARQAQCAPSLLSYVESGHRRLHPWLAEKLDGIYETGGVVTSLARRAEERTNEPSHRERIDSDVFVVQLPQGGGSMALSRREVLAALSIGLSTGKLQDEFERALDRLRLNAEPLKLFTDALEGFQEAARTLPPHHLADGLLGNIAVLDGLRRRAPERDSHYYNTLQARYAESLSWLSEEAGDLRGAMYWIDRTCQWADSANWQAMTAYCFVRRSMVVISFLGDGQRAADQARHVLTMRDTSPRIRGLAAKQMAYGYALAGKADDSRRYLSHAMECLSQPAREDDTTPGQRSVVDDDLFTIFQATCNTYLGFGPRVAAVLEPRLPSVQGSSLRTATITRAKLARAYANAGDPEASCQMAWETLDSIDSVDSLSARSELHRTVPLLRNWRSRSDVQDVVRRLQHSSTR